MNLKIKTNLQKKIYIYYNMKKILCTLLFALILSAEIVYAQGNIQTFTITWSGQNNNAAGIDYTNVLNNGINGPSYSFNPDATAIATITMDTSVLGNQYFGSMTNVISALTMTVSGADSGNGTYTLADFANYNILFSATSPIDWTQNLIGQSGFDDAGNNQQNNFRSDFNFIGNGLNGLPSGVWYETLAVGSDNRNLMQISSFQINDATLPVPEPNTFALFAIGLTFFYILRIKNNNFYKI
jgi:hypothetical protein